MEEVSEQYAGGNILDAGCHDCIGGSVDALLLLLVLPRS